MNQKLNTVPAAGQLKKTQGTLSTEMCFKKIWYGAQCKKPRIGDQTMDLLRTENKIFFDFCNPRKQRPATAPTPGDGVLNAMVERRTFCDAHAAEVTGKFIAPLAIVPGPLIPLFFLFGLNLWNFWWCPFAWEESSGNIVKLAGYRGTSLRALVFRPISRSQIVSQESLIPTLNRYLMKKWKQNLPPT